MTVAANMPSTVSAQSLRPLVARLRAVGLRVAPLLTRHGLTLDVLNDPAARLPHAQAVALWEAAAEAAQAPCFGLQAATFLTRDDFGVLPMVLATSATVREGLQRLVHLHALVHDPPTLSLEATPGDGLALVHSMPPGEPTSRHVTELVLAGCFVALRQATADRDAVPTAIRFSHPAPLDPSEHHAVFGVAPEFSAPRSELVLPAALLVRPHVLAAPQVLSVLEAHAESALTHLTPVQSLAQRVRTLLTADDGPALDAPTLAHRLALSERSLRRHLAEEGTSLTALRDEARASRALDLVTATARPLADIAEALGFSDVSAFSRAFKRWHHRPPSSFRAH